MDQLDDQRARQTIGQERNPSYFSRSKGSTSLPEIVQPTLIAISSTYIISAIVAHFNLLAFTPATSQFAYYCCILGLVSAAVFYLKFLYPEDKRQYLLHLGLLVFIMVAYIIYWCVGVKRKLLPAIL